MKQIKNINLKTNKMKKATTVLKEALIMGVVLAGIVYIIAALIIATGQTF